MQIFDIFLTSSYTLYLIDNGIAMGIYCQASSDDYGKYIETEGLTGFEPKIVASAITPSAIRATVPPHYFNNICPAKRVGQDSWYIEFEFEIVYCFY